MSDTKVTAVFKCTSKTTSKDYPNARMLTFIPPYSVDKTPGAPHDPAIPVDERYKRVNDGWSEATPSGSLSMTITNPIAHEAFEVDEIYLLTFEKFPR